MNCKIGDLAITVTSELPENLGKLVKIVGAKGLSWWSDFPEPLFLWRVQSSGRRHPWYTNSVQVQSRLYLRVTSLITFFALFDRRKPLKLCPGPFRKSAIPLLRLAQRQAERSRHACENADPRRSERPSWQGFNNGLLADPHSKEESLEYE